MSDPQNDPLHILTQDKGNQIFDEPVLEWDHERPIAGPSNVPQEVHVKTPNLEVIVRPYSTPTAPRGRPKGSGKRQAGLPTRDLHQWLEGVDPSHGRPSLDSVVTRSGRISRTPDRYSSSHYQEVSKELKNLNQALGSSNVEVEKSKNSQAGPVEDIVPTLPSVRFSSKSKEKASSGKTQDNKSQESDPFKKSTKMSRD